MKNSTATISALLVLCLLMLAPCSAMATDNTKIFSLTTDIITNLKNPTGKDSFIRIRIDLALSSHESEVAQLQAFFREESLIAVYHLDSEFAKSQAGQEKLRKHLLDRFQHISQQYLGTNVVEDVLFTTYLTN